MSVLQVFTCVAVYTTEQPCVSVLQVFTCVAAAVSMHRLSHEVREVCELRRHLQGVCHVTVSEATKDLCIIHGSWLDIARAKLCISQVSSFM